MGYTLSRCGLMLAITAALLIGCKQSDQPASTQPADSTQHQSVDNTQASQSTEPAAQQGPVKLEDITELNQNYIMGITYQPALNKYEGLARAIHEYSTKAQNEVKQAASGLQQKPVAPYELSLDVSILTETPEIVVASAAGSQYTGGAHGMPLIQRFVWLPQSNEMLETKHLITSENGWRAISDYVREHLRSALSQRLDQDNLTPEERSASLKSGFRMIDDGTAPDAANFQNIEPIVASDGKITALRFVFAPYDVGPYSDGTQIAEVPSSVLLPYIAEKYKPLFR